MKPGMIGLERMGSHMARRLLEAHHDCGVFDLHPQAALDLTKSGAMAARSLTELVAKLWAPRAIWIMVPAAVVDFTLAELAPLLTPDDTVVDGGNSYYHDDIRRAKTLGESGIHYVDVGTSGGVWGFERGCCQMIGGDPVIVKRLDGIFAALAPGADDATTSGASGNGTEGVPAPVLSTALTQRFASRGDEDFADQLLSAMRYGFGGHEEKH